MVDGAFDAAKKAMIGENSMESLVGTLLSREEPEEMTREEYEYTIKWAAGSLYGGMCNTYVFFSNLMAEPSVVVQLEPNR